MEQVSSEARRIEPIRGLGMPKYNYEAMWDKLWLEMEHLMDKNVSTIHPTIVLGYMGFISQEERIKQLVKGE